MLLRMNRRRLNTIKRREKVLWAWLKVNYSKMIVNQELLEGMGNDNSEDQESRSEKKDGKIWARINPYMKRKIISMKIL